MKLPEKFSFRVSGHEGYTHVAKRLDADSYKVKWARGWYSVKDIEWDVCGEQHAKAWASSGEWIIADEEKPQEDALPKSFLCTYENRAKPYNAEVINDRVYVWLDSWTVKAEYKIHDFKNLIGKGGFQILDKKPLTAEQKRANKEFRERIAALNSSIKLTQQSIEHYNRMVANYEQQIKDLEAKIVEGDE